MKTLLFTLSVLIFTLSNAQSNERISLHLFDLPEGISISEFQADLSKANEIYEKNGFGKNRYKVYQVAKDDESQEFRYMWLSTWISTAEYKASHSNELQQFWDEYFYPKYETILDAHIYRKFFAVK
jgi:hypothetical protein